MSRELFNSQGLLFDKTRLTKNAGHCSVPTDYYEHGWTVIDGIDNEVDALAVQEDFIHSIDRNQLKLQRQFGDHIQLAKADQIPVCDDIVATSFQVLHFDMGQPFLESENQLLITHVGIYLPKDSTHEVTACTRLVDLKGLLKHLDINSEEIEKKVTNYVRKYGDGWAGHNTYRLACFARFLDALSDKPELQDQIDKTVGQWFQNEQKVDEKTAYERELEFYAKHSIDLKRIEHQVRLKPGQLLVLDNTRVIHGRIGKRRAKELYNFMFGIKSVGRHDIASVRQFICRQVTAA